MTKYSPAFRIIKGGVQPAFDEETESESDPRVTPSAELEEISGTPFFVSGTDNSASIESLEFAPTLSLKRRSQNIPQGVSGKTGAAATDARNRDRHSEADPAFFVKVPRLHLAKLGSYWLADGKSNGHSERTLEFRRDVLKKLDWFLEDRGWQVCGVEELKDFIGHVRHGHEESQGRWGNPKNRAATRPLTIHRYWRELQTLFNYCVREDFLQASPMKKVEEPEKKAAQIPHLTEDQIQAMLRACQNSAYPLRNTAILMMLLDTGLRATELVSLKFGDVNLFCEWGGEARVLGKGNKIRNVPFSRETSLAIRSYIRREIGRDFDQISPQTALFISERGVATGSPMSRDALRTLIYRLAAAAGIQRGVTKCSPHVFRHTFAFMSLMEGASEKTLKDMLGHATLHMTHQYVNLSDSDLRNQHQKFSPVQRLKRKKGR